MDLKSRLTKIENVRQVAQPAAQVVIYTVGDPQPNSQSTGDQVRIFLPDNERGDNDPKK
jgi:Ni2+-binding GTPase involved in maturation of urease and hydrogenase